MMNMKTLHGAGCFLVAAAMGVANVSAAGQAATQQSKPLPRVLLIGDSISGGYTKGVVKLLAGKAEVVKNEGNGEHTGTGLKRIDQWLGDGKWDVIHFNWGLWDVAYRNPESKNLGHLDKVNGKITTPLADYENNLRELVARMKKTGAVLIWASTTPVPDGEPGRIKGDEVRYNAAAAKIMAENGVAIDDLHATVLPQLEKLQQPANVHFKGAGCDALARQVAHSILAALAGRGAAGAVGLANMSAAQKDDAATKTQPPATAKPVKELQDDFLKLKFGMFIHYNMATYKGVQWVEGYPSPAEFNPGGKIDTDAWADAAKSAGMKYAVLTAKHVGGFCLWDSKYTTYDVMHPDCPYKQDLVAQFIKSFTSRGLKVGLYYAWRHPGFNAKYKVLPPECDPATHSLKEQNDFQMKQIVELIEKYPDVFYIWNDALDPKIMPEQEGRDFIESLRRIRPDLIASSNWWDWGKKGTPYADIAVKEMRHFPENNTYPGETCWCLEKSWFWSEGASPKSARQVVDLLSMVNKRNSNFLLNVGPDKQGKFDEARVKVLAEVGKLRAASTSDSASSAGPGAGGK